MYFELNQFNRLISSSLDYKDLNNKGENIKSKNF